MSDLAGRGNPRRIVYMRGQSRHEKPDWRAGEIGRDYLNRLTAGMPPWFVAVVEWIAREHNERLGLCP